MARVDIKIKDTFRHGSIVLVNDTIVKNPEVIKSLMASDREFYLIIKKRLLELKKFSGIKRYYFELEN